MHNFLNESPVLLLSTVGEGIQKCKKLNLLINANNFNKVSLSYCFCCVLISREPERFTEPVSSGTHVVLNKTSITDELETDIPGSPPKSPGFVRHASGNLTVNYKLCAGH